MEKGMKWQAAVVDSDSNITAYVWDWDYAVARGKAEEIATESETVRLCQVNPEAGNILEVASRFLRRQATISELRAAVKAARIDRVETLVEKRDALKREMLMASPDQLEHSWSKWGAAGEIQSEIDSLLEE